ncbi:gliding motility-associated C-terminal domain-containing protein [Taibaiella lutea]|uniref:Gliding motility-associated C-terminal domain-containing protein n=1 Tax=Taibaiella lutea TaxID=2608001 RepID=A0A5M6CM48_9BACT|nr:gliding motility-associated C-terminal domain-containing protein [Taibaiella lutea]KAA5535052.1 gliding motility-associated C-terminal domain-containing protein [Taibaiella lutea]
MENKVSGRTGKVWRLFAALFLLMVVVPGADAQQYTLEWQKAYDWDSQMSTGDQAFDIQATNDNGYILAGRTNLDILWDAKGRVTKLNSAGAVEWDKMYGDSTATCYLNSIRQTQDGGYIALGSMTAMNTTTGMASGWHGSYDLLVLKLDASGNVQWHKCLGGSSDEEPGAIRQTADGGYIVSGSTASDDGDVPDNNHFDINNPSFDLWLIKLNASGNIVWQHTYGGSSDEIAAGTEVLSDGSFIVCGNTSSNDGDVSGSHGLYPDGWILKVTSNGTFLWQRCFGSSGEERFFNIVSTTDNGFMAAGYTSDNGGNVTGFHGGFYDAWVVKINSAGNQEWQRTIGGSGTEMAGAVKQLPDGGYAVAGEGNSADGDVPALSGERDVWVCYLSNDGGITGSQDFGGINNDGYYGGWSAMYLGVNITTTIDNGLAVTASTQSPDIPGFVDNSEFYVIKLKGKPGCDTTVTVSDTVICNSDPFLVTLHSTIMGGDSYRWVNSVPGPAITVVLPGTYFCNVLTGCNFHTDTIHVLLPVALPQSLGLDNVNVCKGSDFIIGNKESIKGIQYLWNTGERQSFIHPEKEGVYTLSVSNGCDSRDDSANVTFMECNQCLFVPNAFSPDGDGLNDVFGARNLCEIKSFQIQVYNRWGQLVFNANNIAEKWDGTYNNGVADVGAYFYQISFTSADNTIQYRKGEIMLIR